MRKQRWLVPIVLVTVALLGAACGGNDSPTVSGDSTASTTGRPSFPAGTTMAKLQAKGKIVLGTKFDQPGLGQKNPLTGEVEGFDPEIAKIVAAGIFGGKPADAGKYLDPKETTSPNRELFIENGTVDIVVATYTINDTRKQRVDFAGPYYVAHQDIMVKADDNSIKSVADLAGKRVCSVRNSTPAGRIRTMVPDADLQEFDTYTLCKEELLNGRTDAVTTDDAILLGFASENPTALKVVGNQFSTEPYGIGLQRGDDAFRTFINDLLEQSYSNGQWKAAFDATLGKSGVQAPTPPPVDRYSSLGVATSVAGETTTSSGETTTTAGGSTTTTAPATTSTTG
jgi:glutamate transport system substrate-binding protein